MRTSSVLVSLFTLFSSAAASHVRTPLHSRQQAKGVSDCNNNVARNNVQHDLVVSEGMHSPDGGKERYTIFMNGKFGSEVITVDEGDTLELNVISQLSRPFTLHGHGINHKAVWMDGVPGVTQKSIEPGENFTYVYELNQHGFYHLHAHYKGLQDDGLYMGLVVRPAASRQKPFDKISSNPVDQAQLAETERNTIPILVSDYRHYSSDEVLQIWESSNIEPLCVHSVLVNGQGSRVCVPQYQLDAFAEKRGKGNLTALGCLPISSPILNPEVDGFGLQSNASAVPLDSYETCDNNSVGAPLYTVEVDAVNGWAILAFVNAGGLWEQRVSIDEHPMYVFDVEGEYVNVSEPVEVISLASGFRMKVAIKLDKAPGSAYTIRVASNVVPQIISGYAVLQYSTILNSTLLGGSADLVAQEGFPALPTSTPYMGYDGAPLTIADGLEANATVFVENGPAAAPLVSTPPPSTDSVGETLFFDLSRPNATMWAMNHTGLHQSLYEDIKPIIWSSVWKPIAAGEVPQEDMAAMASDSVLIIPELGTVVDMIFTVKENGPPHPIHKHLNKFWVIGEGSGSFNWTTVAEAAAAIPESFNFETAPLRDGYNTPVAIAAQGGSWLALRYVVEEAGPQVLHCHISQHATGGMVGVILQAMEKLELPAEFDAPA
ncbi:multicopper oxidase [Cylindrobasidium torrendii FP15055 ss-10]|uniref:Multicopper oxidase n=1 Tax=Cylindrobasidium torrendii FP15055 ss-10 TaxID=1314674 RepID=A0A0D7BCF9_9AGAR|nr:multicopper oxidase [Cylindrobasidium torrendii FP15055 ss-10]